MRIALLHSLENNPAVFDRAAADVGLARSDLHHEVHADLRVAVEQQGRLTEQIKADIHACLEKMAAASDVVIVTCGTIGAAIDETTMGRVPVLRTDKALAQSAARAGGHIVVVCAAESALEGTRRLFEAHATGASATVTIRHVPKVWDLYKQGDLPAALEASAAAAEDAFDTGADVVAFAHPWMADAVPLGARGRVPLDSVHAALSIASSLR